MNLCWPLSLKRSKVGRRAKDEMQDRMRGDGDKCAKYRSGNHF